MKLRLYLMAFFAVGSIFTLLIWASIVSDRLMALPFIWLLGWCVPSWLEERLRCSLVHGLLGRIACPS